MRKTSYIGQYMTAYPFKKKVGAYCRVSTIQSEQQHSYEVQKMYFQQLFANSSTEELVDVYADYGISGTKAETRPEFQRMLDDCRTGRIERIYTKSISRFARNTKDCLVTLRELKRLGVTVCFEKEGIDTARISDEIMVTIMEGLAQEESRSISNNVRWSFRRRMANGTLGISRVPYGYEKKGKNLIINEEKAAIVRRIFSLYLCGNGARRIAVIFNDEGIPSPTGKKWNNMTILKILKQEKYIGDIRWQKTWSEFMGKMWQINRGQADSFYIRDCHPAVISREDFITVQALLQKSKSKSYTKSSSPFRGKLRCTCGRSYYYNKANHRDYWKCSGRFDYTDPCKNPIIYDDALNAAWQRLCAKLSRHADEIITPCLVQLSILEEKMNSGEIAELEQQEKELRQRRYVLCKLCAENCISHEKLFQSEIEIDSKLSEIKAKIGRLSEQIDDTAEKLEMLYKHITTVSSERLIDFVLENAVIDNGTVCFELTGGLTLKEVL